MSSIYYKAWYYICKYSKCALQVFSTFGGLGREATIFYSHFANLLAIRHSIQSSQMLSWMCCTISFSLLRSPILAIRGSGTLTFTEHLSISTELCLVESHIDLQFNELKLAFVANNDLLILDCQFSHLIWSDVMSAVNANHL